MGLRQSVRGDLGTRGEDEGKIREVVREAGGCLSLPIVGFQFQSVFGVFELLFLFFVHHVFSFGVVTIMAF